MIVRLTIRFLMIAMIALCSPWTQASDAPNLGKEPPLKATVKDYHGVPTLFLNGEPRNLLMYSITGAGGRQLRHIASFRDAGIHFYEVPLNFFECFAADGTANFGAVEHGLKEVLQRDPQAYILIRIFFGSPGWWIEKHPNEMVEYAGAPKDADGKSPVGPVAIASEQWLKNTDTFLRRYLKFTEHSPYSKRILGYHLCAGTTGEWHYDNFSWLPDTGQAMTRRFRAWLKETYGDRPEFAQAAVPGIQERSAAHDGLFRDPTTSDQRVIDYYHCQQQVVRDAILHLCRTAKELAPTKLIGVFYGYYFHMGGCNFQAEGGHLCVHDILESPYVDFLSGPYSYEHHSRRVGGEGTLRPLVETVKAHGKLFMSESDSPTHLGDSQGNDLVGRGLTSVEGSLAVMKRDFINVLTHGISMWWFDVGPPDAQGGLAGGWWDTPELMAAFKRMREIGELSLTLDRRSAAEVLVVCNPETYYYIAWSGSGKDKLLYPLLNDTVREIFRSGAPFDVISAGDLGRISLEQYKAFVFLDTFYLNRTARQVIEDKIKRNGRTVLWVYAPGYINEDGLSVERMSALTGITLKKETQARRGRIEVIDPNQPLVAAVSNGFGVEGPVNPMFFVADPKAVPMGRISGTNNVGLAMRKFPNWTSIYSYAPPIHPAFLRNVFKQAGVHIYNESDDVLYANRHFLAINTDTGGRRSIRLPQRCDVTDLFRQKIVRKNTNTFEIGLKPKSVELFLLTPPTQCAVGKND